MMPRVALMAGAFLTITAVTACDRILPERASTTMPELAVLDSLYARSVQGAEVRYSGNVVEVVVQQPSDQLRRGGTLWARVGPYIYLFSPVTRQVLTEYPAVAGVRVITMEGRTEVARALLLRDRLNEITWRRAHNVLGTALEQGTERPSTMDRLVQFGEEHTEYEYNPDYVPPRR
jgi:hypothetical protein